MIKIFVGFDEREGVAFHTFSQSLIDNSSVPFSITPLVLSCLKDYSEVHTDGSNAFIYSRFLVPWLCDFEGWALFADGDMICQEDIKELWDFQEDSVAVKVVKHDYKTKFRKKYLGNVNEDYPRKNWSSLILWNCAHPANRVLTPQLVSSKPGSYLHRFSWLPDHLVGELPKEWNWLVDEYESNARAKLLHYTVGTPCFREYRNGEMSDIWMRVNKRVSSGMD